MASHYSSKKVTVMKEFRGAEAIGKGNPGVAHAAKSKLNSKPSNYKMSLSLLDDFLPPITHTHAHSKSIPQPALKQLTPHKKSPQR